MKKYAELKDLKRGETDRVSDVQHEYVLAIDPGPEKSGIVVLKHDIRNESFTITEKAIMKNEEIFKKMFFLRWTMDPTIVIEQVTSYGMSIGQTVIDSIFWIGRFYQKSIEHNSGVMLIPRKDIKLHLCHSSRAKDKNVNQRLRDKFGEKGTIKNKGKLYGISSHTWSALAVGITYLEKKYGEIQ